MTPNEACRLAMKVLEKGPSHNMNDLNVLYELSTGHKRYDLTHDVSEEEFGKLMELAERRASGEPLQYISGIWPFLDFEIIVDRRALIPRPETEILAETAAELLKDLSHPEVLDLCSGTGVLAFSAKRACPEAHVTAVELSHDASALLKENAAKLSLDIDIVVGDALACHESIPDSGFDLIICNPPYITPEDYSSNFDELKEEPKMAFLGGDDGLDFYRTIIPCYKSKLRSGGHMAFEIGNDQAEAVTALFRESGYHDITVRKDYFSLDRIVYAAVD